MSNARLKPRRISTTAEPLDFGVIGTGAGSQISTGSKNVILGSFNGNQGGLDIRTASNYIVLSDGDGNPRGIFDGSGNFLIGKTAIGNTTTGWQLLSNGFGTAVVTISTTNQAFVWNNTSTAGTASIEFRANDVAKGSISWNNTNTTYNTTSDYRLKHDIAPITGALAKVAALKPVTYKWDADNSDGEGFIAHELAEVCPFAVTGKKDAVDAEGKPIYQGIDTSFLVATLTAAIQELKSELDSVKAELATLKGN